MAKFGQSVVAGALVFMTMMAIPFWLEEKSEKHAHNNNVKEVISFTETILAEITPQFTAINHYLVYSNGIRTFKDRRPVRQRHSSSVEFYITVPYQDLFRASPTVEQVVNFNFCSISERLGRYKFYFDSNATDLSKEERNRIKHDFNQPKYYQDKIVDCHEQYSALYDKEYPAMQQRLKKLPFFRALYMYRQNEGIRASISHRLDLTSWPYNSEQNTKIKALIEAGDFSFRRDLKALKKASLYDYCSFSTAIKSFQLTAHVSLSDLPDADRKNITDSGVFDALNQYFNPFKSRDRNCS